MKKLIKMDKLFLFACASVLATNALSAAEKQTDYRQSSGTFVNSVSTEYSAPADSFSPDSGVYYSRYVDVTDREDSLRWDSAKNAFYDVSTGKYCSVDTIIALSGNAVFRNTCTGNNPFGLTVIIKEKSKVDELQKESGSSGLENNIYLFDSAVLINENNCRIALPNTYNHNNKPLFDVNFLLTGTSRIENYGVLYSRAFNNGHGLFIELNNSSSLLNMGCVIDFSGIEIYDNASMQNFNWMEAAEMSLFDSAKYQNFGTSYSTTTLVLDPDDDDDSSLFKNALVYKQKDVSGLTYWTGSRAYYPVNFEIEADDPNDDFDADEVSSATYENYGQLYGFGSNLISAPTVYVYNENQKNQLKNLNFRNRLNFKNYGTVDAYLGDAAFGSLVTLTVASGSKFNGKVSLGNAEEIYVNDNDTQTKTSEALSETSYLNVILGAGTDTTNALLGTSTTFNKKVDLTVSSESSSMKQKVKLYSSATNTSSSTVSASDFVATTGTFTSGGRNYTWTLCTDNGENCGVIEAKLAGGTIEEKNFSSETASLKASELSANTYVTFDDSVSSFSGKIESTNGETTNCEIAVTKDITFTGDLSAHNGLLSIGAGKTLTLKESGKLGSGNIEISNQGTLSVQTDTTIANDISGMGILEIDSAVVSITGKTNVGTILLSTSSSSTSPSVLKGSVYLDGTNLQCFSAGNSAAGCLISLFAVDGEQITLANDATVSLNKNYVKLSLTGKTGIEAEDLNSADAKKLTEKLKSGDRVTIFSGSGNVYISAEQVLAQANGEGTEDFLKTDAVLENISKSRAVVFRQTESELSLRVVAAASELVNVPAPEGLDSGFAAALIGSETIASISDTIDANGFVNERSLGNDPIITASLNNDVSAAQKILRNASPIGYAAMTAVPVAGFYNDLDSVSARLKHRRMEAKISKDDGTPKTWEFFAQAQGSVVDNGSGSDDPAFDFDTYGVLAGADNRFSETLVGGIAVGYESGSADIHDSGGDIDVEDFRAMVFLEKTLGERGFVNGGAQLGFGEYDATRRSAYGEASGDADGWSFGFFATTGLRFDISETFSATPYVGLSYARAKVSSFDESGTKALGISSFSGESLRGRFGVSLDWALTVAEKSVQLGLDFAYARDFLSDEVDIDYSLGGQSFTATTAMMSEDVFSVSPTASVALTDSSSIYAAYTFATGTDSSTAHSANIGYRYRF